MAETVYLNDGSTEVIFTEKQVFFERLLRERLGYDAARCFKDWLEEQNEDQKDWESTFKEQEKITDFYLALCHEAVENFQAVLDLLDEPRLDRKKIVGAVTNGYNALYKNL